MMSLTHSPNCCCDYCMSKGEDNRNKQEKLSEGVPTKEAMNHHDDKSYLTPDYIKKEA